MFISVNDLPHHFNDALAAFIVENGAESAGEMIKVNRTSDGRGGITD
jgi:hypothetical protein